MTTDLDSYDRHALRLLQTDGRMSNRDLAEAIHLSPTPCWRRIRELERSGVIRGYRAELDPSRIGLNLTVLAQVELDNHHPNTVAAFDRAINAIPEVLECHMVSGDHDYFLKIIARDMQAYSEILRTQLLQLPGVNRISSTFVMRSAKATGSFPVY